jgi:hypothetical protein
MKKILISALTVVGLSASLSLSAWNGAPYGPPWGNPWQQGSGAYRPPAPSQEQALPRAENPAVPRARTYGQRPERAQRPQRQWGGYPAYPGGQMPRAAWQDWREPQVFNRNYYQAPPYGGQYPPRYSRMPAGPDSWSQSGCRAK